MYDNGRNLNRYHAKRFGKRKMQRRHMRSWGDHTSWRDYVAHKPERDDLEYWRAYYFSGRRAFASDCTNRKLRAEFRAEKAVGDYENMYAPQGANYRKHFDYWWTVY